MVVTISGNIARPQAHTHSTLITATSLHLAQGWQRQTERKSRVRIRREQQAVMPRYKQEATCLPPLWEKILRGTELVRGLAHRTGELLFTQAYISICPRPPI